MGAAGAKLSMQDLAWPPRARVSESRGIAELMACGEAQNP